MNNAEKKICLKYYYNILYAVTVKEHNIGLIRNILQKKVLPKRKII